MRAYIAFTKKEFLEFTRSYKLLILVIIFMIFGFMNPIMAKYTPLIIEEFMPEGMNMQVPDPIILDSWVQFFKNLTQIGLILFLVICTTVITTEFSKGTFVNMITKGLSRKTIILSKFSFIVLLWTLCYFLSAAITFGYNFLFWSNWNLPHLLFSISCVWLFGVLLFSFLLFGGILVKNFAGALLCTGIGFVIMTILQLIPSLQDYNPIQLITGNMELLQNTMQPSAFLPAIEVSCLLIIVLVLFSIRIFQKKAL